MKYLITLLLICVACNANDAIDKLENSYVNKAEQLKTTRDQGVKQLDTKYQSDSRRLALAYILALRKIEISIVKKGDLDGALIVRAKIKEIEAILKGEAVAVVKPKPVHNSADTIVGKWHWQITRRTVEFGINGYPIINGKPDTKVKWSKLAPFKYRLAYERGKYEILLLSKDGKTLDITVSDGRKFKATRLTTDVLLGKWRWPDGDIIEYTSKGTYMANGRNYPQSKWKKTGPYKYHVNYGKGVYINISLSKDGKTITIVTSKGQTLTATRISK